MFSEYIVFLILHHPQNIIQYTTGVLELFYIIQVNFSISNSLPFCFENKCISILTQKEYITKYLWKWTTVTLYCVAINHREGSLALNNKDIGSFNFQCSKYTCKNPIHLQRNFETYRTLKKWNKLICQYEKAMWNFTIFSEYDTCTFCTCITMYAATYMHELQLQWSETLLECSVLMNHEKP